jgi:hypothetical protein
MTLNAVVPITIQAPADTEITVTHLVSFNGSFEIMLVDGKLGEDLLPMDGPIDFVLFAKHDEFEIGTITPDRPLRLYFKAAGFPSVLPLVNGALLGTTEAWVAPPPTAPVKCRQSRNRSKAPDGWPE